jgi:hypothetical protein
VKTVERDSELSRLFEGEVFEPEAPPKFLPVTSHDGSRMTKNRPWCDVFA